MSSRSHSSLSDMRSGPTFSSILKPVAAGMLFFGASTMNSACLGCMSHLVFYCTVIFMAFVLYVGAFLRDAIDIWIQLSIYAVPILTLFCGYYAFNSPAYHRLLSRNLATESMVTFFLPPPSQSSSLRRAPAPAHSKTWMSGISLKSLVFPFSLEVLQWSAMLGFYRHTGGSWSFMGTKIHVITERLWVPIYCAYWSVALYVVGFLAFQFVFVSRLIIRDAVSLMNLFGASPYLHVVSAPVYKRRSFLMRIAVSLLNFFTFDLIASLEDQTITSNFGVIDRSSHSKKPAYEPPRVLSKALEEGTVEDVAAEGDSISPREASSLAAEFMFEIQDIAGVFTPFNVCVSFFSVASLITHVCLFAIKDNEHMQTWTLFRTFIWIYVCLRVLVCVFQITNLLGKIENHVRYLYAAGRLSRRGKDHEWLELFKLLGSFQLGRRSYGFPLTLKQVASIATFLNMTFLIILSVLKPLTVRTTSQPTNKTNTGVL